MSDVPFIPASEVTPKHLYLNRRRFMQVTGTLVGGVLIGACNMPEDEEQEEVAAPEEAQASAPAQPAAPAQAAAPGVDYGSLADELGDVVNEFKDITNYNNFYEFTVDKGRVAPMSKGFVTSPWSVDVGGLVDNPKTYTLEDIYGFAQEDRVYRLRCVEAWSMVIPWRGFPLSALLDQVKPQSGAKYVRFETLYDPQNLPGQKGGYNWPYVEGLRMDEAMHPLTLLGTGLYGENLPPQNGAPVRVIVPWKYGFKSIKSIVKIDLVEEMPTSLWMSAAPNEYGFYSNVNPNVNHPRWSQSRERRIGERGQRETLLFNGYEDQVASLYEGMDLKANY